MTRLRALRVDPGVRAIAVFVLAAIAGLVAVGAGWSGIAGRVNVALQLPYLASGVIGGVALTAASLTLLSIHLDRRAAAVRGVAFEELLTHASRVAEQLEKPRNKARRPT